MNLLLDMTLPSLNLVTDSLGWAVIHSLWQGLVAAGIVVVVRALTRERASEARYFMGIIVLCALLCAFIATFLYYYNTGAAAMSLGLGQEETVTLALPSAIDAASTNPLMRLGDFTGLIGMFWTVCFAVLGVRYLAAFQLTHKLRTHGLTDLPADCQARFRALVEVSGVTPKVRAYFSDYVSSPITFGFLKPIVLVPTWFFTGMTPEQCEAVLLHELAHIRRHDYLTNILQIAIKTVFFYHPAVQFICKGLDTDREHACDDFAVMLTKNPEGLATALGTIRLRAARDGGVFALSADGRDAPLMHRLKRLMGTQSSNGGGTSMEKGTSRGLAATAMIGTALALVMTLGATASQAHPHKNQVEVPDVEAPDWDKLAGAATTDLAAWGSKVGATVTVKGKVYKATSFDFSTDGKGTDIINGKKYPSKYAYSVYAKDGKSYVVKQKKGKRYMEIGDNWYRIDADSITGSFAMPTPPAPPSWSENNGGYSYGYAVKDGHQYQIKTKNSTGKSHIKIDGEWKSANIIGSSKPNQRRVKISGLWYDIKDSNAETDYVYGQVKIDGQNLPVKTQQKSGKSYAQLGGAWVRVKNKWVEGNRAPSKIKVNGKWYNIAATTVPTPPTPPTSSANNYWVNDEVLAGAETRAERASERREAALERAEEMREREMERAEEQREEAQERAEEQREAVWERAEEAREEAEERREEARERKREHAEQGQEMARELTKLSREMKRDQAELMQEYEQDKAELQRELGNDSRELAQDMAELKRELAQDQADLAKGFTQEQAELSREMAKVMAQTQANWNVSQYANTNYNVNNNGAQRARDMEQRIRDKQQEVRNKTQQKRQEKQYARNYAMAEKQRIKADTQRADYEEMRDRLIPLLKADGFMKSDKSKTTIKMTPTDIFINGKKLADAQEGKYCDIVSDYIDRKGDVKKIIIKPGYLHVSQKGGENNTSYTYNEN